MGGGGLSKVMLWLTPLDCVCSFLLMILLIDSTHLRMDLPAEGRREFGVELHDWTGVEEFGVGGMLIPGGRPLTSELDFAGDVLLELSPQLRIVLKVVEMMLHPLAENIQNPARQRLCYYTSIYIYTVYTHTCKTCIYTNMYI